MAITENKKYALIPIKENWSNFRVENSGKEINIYGYDGETFDQWAGVFNKEQTEPQPEEVFLASIEQHRSDMATWDILGDASDEDGKRYLVLVRLEN